MTHEGKVAVVTGGTGGLGQAVVVAFVRAGAAVGVTYRSEDELAALEAELGKESVYDAARFLALKTELTDEAAVGAAFDSIEAKLGGFDILVNLVGGWRGGKTVAETDLTDLDWLLDVNLRAPFVTCKAAFPRLAARGWGRIVNVSARASLVGPAKGAMYAVSKRPVITLTESLAAEGKDAGVTANAVLPSVIGTNANRRNLPDADQSRWVEPEDIAEVILFLASEEAGIVSGGAIPVYGRA